jgi:hypothetical protein
MAGQEQTGTKIKPGLEEMKASKTVANRRKLEMKTEAYPEESDANQEKLEAAEEHYEGATRDKDTHVLTAPQGQTSEVLRGTPKRSMSAAMA